ncbi:arsenate reductase ArsC [Candidatus Contubernalis alkaliaceticus]|uniref:arsenate reductase ArsC n=1 Tax=Candidatus Contubernalis alkaliaceticus TaxID=338645 RepID=UPI001F4BF90E|nr:arsenate reductase ArsC [Candidatus Contubernalis alkalaceticus]UNC92227.1 arsenate reductase ArsC [Candidatus Contubernalis alkalaceticus]
MKKKKILFVCIHNSARSQMAEAFVELLAGDRFEAHSAGLEPGNLNPLVVEVMKEIDIDISGKKTKNVFDYYKNGTLFSYVITVCDQAGGERCPLFPGLVKRIHWGFPDPSSFEGSYQEKLEKTRIVRDEIKETVTQWLETI